MTSAMDDIAKKFDSFESLMTQALDKLSGLEAWRASTEAATDKLLSQSELLSPRLHRLEAVSPPPPPRPAMAPPQTAPRWTDPFDLNLAPPLGTRPSASSAERPSGHRPENNHRDVGGGILGLIRHARSRV